MHEAMESGVFLPSISPDTDRALSQAIACFDDTAQAEKIILDAVDASEQKELGAFVALYKFYFYKKDFAKALGVAYETMDKAATMGGFTSNWRELTCEDVKAHTPESPARAFLYTMKALGFIYLRLEQCEQSMAILNKLSQLDIHDVVGSSVVMDVAKRICDVDDE